MTAECRAPFSHTLLRLGALSFCSSTHSVSFWRCTGDSFEVFENGGGGGGGGCEAKEKSGLSSSFLFQPVHMKVDQGCR